MFFVGLHQGLFSLRGICQVMHAEVDSRKHEGTEQKPDGNLVVRRRQQLFHHGALAEQHGTKDGV